MTTALKKAAVVAADPAANEANNPAPERRTRGRSAAPGFPSRKGEKRVEGLTRSELVVKYSMKVRSIAGQISHRLPPWVDIDDLIGVGYIGLMDAADKFDPKRGVKFDTYAGIRIRGAMMDELRNQDWVPRTARSKAKAIEAAADRLLAQNGRTPTDAEMSTELGVSLEDYERYKRTIGALQLVSLSDASQLSGEEFEQRQGSSSAYESSRVSDGNPFSEVSRKDAKEVIQGLLNQLPEQEKIVLSCYYFRGLSLKEIGAILSLSDARISQIHAAGIQRLKKNVAGGRDSSQPRAPSNEALMLMLLDME